MPNFGVEACVNRGSPITTCDSLGKRHQPGYGKCVWIVVGALSLLFCLSSFVPWQPYFIRTSDLDDSWMLALNSVFRTNLQFGRDIVFTYGPWGFVNTRSYHPNTWPWMIAAWIFIAVVFWRVCWVICRRQNLGPAAALLWLTVVSGISALGIDHQNATLLCIICLAPIFYFHRRGHRNSLTSMLLLAAIALASLVKFTYLFAALLVLFPVAIDQIRRRQFPSVLPAFCFFFISLYLLAGQKLSSLWPYLRWSWQIADQYTNAMSFSPGSIIMGQSVTPMPLDLLLFVVAALLLLGSVTMAAWRADRPASPYPTLALAGLIFVLFKWGFVRHDGQHATLAGFALLVLALLYWPALRDQLAGHKARFRLACIVALPALVCWQSIKASSGKGLPTYFAASLFTPVPQNVTSVIGLYRDPNHLAREYADALQIIRDSSPVPSTQGSIDVYPWNQAIPIARGMHYEPRPVFQSYSAYSPELARLNASHLSRPDGPATLLFSVTTGGSALRHFPTADDSLSWPALLTHYDLQPSSGEFLVLTKSPVPRDCKFAPISRLTTTFGKTIKVPSASQGPIWVRIVIKPTTRGKILSTLYKIPELYLTVSTREIKSRTYRLIAGQAEAGFLLSPAVDDDASFAALAMHQPQTQKDVTTLMISDRGWIGSAWAYRPEISISFSRLEFGHPRNDAVFATLDDFP